MVQHRDPSWAGFGAWLVRAMGDAGVSSASLSRQIDSGGRITAGTIAKWRSGLQHPRLSDLPAIARVLRLDAVDLAIQVGVLPPSYSGRAHVDMAVRLSELQSTLATFQAEHLVRARQSALSNLFEAVLERPRWGLAVEPSFEGPTDERIHLADRLAFRRTDGVEPNRADVLDEFGHLLHALHASRSRVGGWPLGSAYEPVRFSAPVYTRPREPGSETPVRPNCPAVVVVSTTIKSWAPVFARHLADSLGYGLTSALDMAASVHNKSIDQTRSAERAEQTFLLIRNPPKRYVSYHYESSEARDSRTLEALHLLSNDGTKLVWLREDDDLLEFAVRHRSDLDRRRQDQDLAATRRFRDSVDDLLANDARLHLTTVQMDLSLPPGSSPRSPPEAIRDEYIAEILAAAHETYAEFRRRRWID
jgi:hypothetical protein